MIVISKSQETNKVSPTVVPASCFERISRPWHREGITEAEPRGCSELRVWEDQGSQSSLNRMLQQRWLHGKRAPEISRVPSSTQQVLINARTMKTTQDRGKDHAKGLEGAESTQGQQQLLFPLAGKTHNSLGIRQHTQEGLSSMVGNSQSSTESHSRLT